MPLTPNIKIANDFFHDSQDLLQRYRLTVDHFHAVKSKRLKLFLDLRVATECILKAYAAYFLMSELSREDAIRRVEKYGHHIKSLATDIKDSVPNGLWNDFSPYIEPLEALPVGLRYRLDGADFRELNEEFYYNTVGSDDWLNSLYLVTQSLTDALNQRLVGHSRILSGQALLDEIVKPSHNKYKKRDGK